MEEVESSTTIAFVGHEYTQDAGSERGEQNCIWYYSYLIPETLQYLDAIDSAYEDSIAFLPKKGRGVFTERSTPSEGESG